MIKENDKVLIAKLILKITFIMTFISVGIKLLGFNLFDADIENKILMSISKFIDNNYMYATRITLDSLLLFLQSFVFYRLSCKNQRTNIYFTSAFISTLIGILSQIIITNTFGINSIYGTYYFTAISFILLIIPPILIDIKIRYVEIPNKNFIIRTLQNLINRIKKPALIFTLLTIYQITILFLRNTNPSAKYFSIYNYMLNFDLIILLLLTFYIHYKKQYSLPKIKSSKYNILNLLNYQVTKNNIKDLLIKAKKAKKRFYKLSKFDKIVTTLYIFFFIIQELLTLGLIVFIANLNDYIIECLFILISFAISKKIFGAFHFKSFILCFVVSNTTFYILSTLTLDVNITFVVPIIFGTILSYISSKFIKKNTILPYRGIPLEDMDELCVDKKLTNIEKSILIDFYCNRINLNKLAIKYSYSDRSIQRIKVKALKKVESM